MSLNRVMVLTFAVGAILAACSARTMSPLPGNVEPAASKPDIDAHSAATLTISLPPIEPAGVPYPWTSTPGPLWLSPATASISGAVGKRHFGPIPLGSGTAACPASSPNAPLQCSFTVSAPKGQNVLLTTTTFASAPATKPLASGSQSVNVFTGSNSARATILGVAQKVETRLMPDKLRVGLTSNNPLVTYGIDAAGDAIPGQLANGGAISVQLSGFVTTTINQSCDEFGYCKQLYCCGVIGTFNYNGLATGTETFRTTSTITYNPTTTKVVVHPGNAQLATLLVGTYLQNGYRNLQFVMGTSGNVSPARSIAVGDMYGEDSAGNYWAATIHYSNTGSVLGTISLPPPKSVGAQGPGPVGIDPQGHIYAITGGACGFTEFPANTYGKLRPIRAVTCSAESSGAPVFDEAGNVYISLPYANGASSILEYPPTGSGSVPPTRAISFPGSGFTDVTGIACDGAGNLYALVYEGGPNQVLLEFAPGSTTGEQILTNVPISVFTVDGAGDVFAKLQTSETGPVALEEFPAGSTTASIVLKGPKTRLTVGVDQIVVPR